MASTPKVRRVDLFDGKAIALEYSWTNDVGVEEERYLYDYRSQEEADYIIGQFRKWVNHLILWKDEFTDDWITDSIRCAHRDRLLWRSLFAA